MTIKHRDQAKEIDRVHEKMQAALEQVKQLIDRAERMIEEYREDAPGSRGPAGN